jgi:hypothetical protein
VVIQTIWALGLVLVLEACVISVCSLKFGKYPATHSWLAKFYGLYLLFSLLALLAFDADVWAIFSFAVVAALADGEIILMHLLSPVPPVDVRSIFHLPKNH